MDTALLKELGATEDTTLRQVKALAQQKVEDLDRLIAAAQEKRQVFAALLGLWNKAGETETVETSLKNGAVASTPVADDESTSSEESASAATSRSGKTKAAPKTTATRSKKGNTAPAKTAAKTKTPSDKPKATRKTKADKPKATEAKAEFDFNALLPKFEGKSYQDAFVQILESEPENEFSVGDIVKEAYGDQLQGNSFMRVCQIVGREMTRGIEQGLWVKSSQKPPRYASKTT